jgi:hypothetical protein
MAKNRFYKSTPEEQAARRANVSKLLLHDRLSPQEIQARLNISPSMYDRDVKALGGSLLSESTRGSLDTQRFLQVAECQRRIEQLWIAWGRSLKAKIIKTSGITAAGEVDTTQTISQNGDPAIMDKIRKEYEHISNLFGLFAPKQHVIELRAVVTIAESFGRIAQRFIPADDRPAFQRALREELKIEGTN